MNEKAEKQAQEKLEKWLKEMEPNEERHCDKDYCDLVKEQHHD